MAFFERYDECCRNQGISPMGQWAAEQIGCNKSTISQFAKNKNIPKGEFVAGAAKMLDVSADYLLCLTDKPHPIEIKYSDKEIEILQMFDELNEEGQDAALAMLTGLLSNSIYKKDNKSEAIPKEA